MSVRFADWQAWVQHTRVGSWQAGVAHPSVPKPKGPSSDPFLRALAPPRLVTPFLQGHLAASAFRELAEFTRRGKGGQPDDHVAGYSHFFHQSPSWFL